jgi:hypothetical protein
MPAYSTRLKQHLSEYKRARLNVPDNGVWSRNGRPYSHILPALLREHNILEEIRADFWEYARAKGLVRHLHSDFHHLTSSQALAFNVFFPFVAGVWAKPSLLTGALELPAREVVSAEFEAVPDREEGTNFDFLATFEDNSRLLIEMKFCETGFGACRNDAKHRKKLKSLYRGRLESKVAPQMLAAPTFFQEYQLLRNVSHLRPEDTLILLLPRANGRPFDHARRFITEALTPGWRHAVKVIALEDFLTRLANAALGTRLEAYVANVSQKYVLASPG